MPRQPKKSGNISEIEDALNRRFFAAVDALVRSGRLHSLSGFCISVGLNPSRYREMRQTYGPAHDPAAKASRYTSVQPEALYYLVTLYGVSAKWLLAGRGSMFAGWTGRAEPGKEIGKEEE